MDLRLARREHWRRLEVEHEVMTAERSPLIRDVWGQKWDGGPVGGAWVVADVTPQGRGRKPKVEFCRVVVLSQTADESLLAYYVALHEMGHILQHKGPRGWRRHRRTPVLWEEADAWQWALDNAIEPPTPEIWAAIAEMMGTYAAAKPGHYKPSPEFDALLELARVSAGLGGEGSSSE